MEELLSRERVDRLWIGSGSISRRFSTGSGSTLDREESASGSLPLTSFSEITEYYNFYFLFEYALIGILVPIAMPRSCSEFPSRS